MLEMGPDRAATGGTTRQSTAFLPVSQVLEEEFVALHGPLPGPARGVDDGDQLPALYEAIHALPEKRAALCLSGGGIRSATFALGVLQGLARAGLLTQFHYLSTVSGGGYIGAWLSAWIHRKGNDAEKVALELASLEPRSKLDPEPEPIAYLREFSNYLSPRAGLMSTDTWTLLGTILRNVILIWLVLVPLLAAVLMLPRLYLSLLRWATNSTGSTLPTVLLVLGGALLAWAVAYIAATIPSSTTARRGQGKFLAFCLLPLLLGLGSLTIYWAAVSGRAAGAGREPLPVFVDFVWFGAVVHLLAWAGYTVWLRTSCGQGRPAKGSLGAQVGSFVAELFVVVVAGAVGGAIAWLLATKLFMRVGHVLVPYAALAPGFVAGTFLLAATALVGLISHWTDDDDREWWSRCGAWFLVSGSAWTVFGTLVLFGPVLLSQTWLSRALAAIGGVSGLVTVVGGWFAKVTSRDKTSTQTSRGDRLMALAVPLAGVVFAAVLVLGLSTLISGLLLGLIKAGGWTIGGDEQWGGWPPGPFNHMGVLLSSPVWLVAGVAIALAGLGLAMARFINTNQFSLHGMYRNRLIRAYLGASNTDRHANPFTGFDDDDNIQLHKLWPRSSDAPAGATAPRRRLLHVVNMALNLVHGERLAWQERKAHTFTASALHAGSLIVGYRRTRAGAGGPHDHYGGTEGMSLGTAITISGAAASPNMGYHSSPLVTFLLTLFNVRLVRPHREHRALRLPVGRRALREPRALRDGAAALPLHRGQRRELRRGRRLPGPGQRGPEDPGRHGRADRLRGRHRHPAPLGGSGPAGGQPLLGPRPHPLLDRRPARHARDRSGRAGRLAALRQARLLRHRAARRLRVRDGPRPLPARADHRPVLQRVAVRELPDARLPRHAADEPRLEGRLARRFHRARLGAAARGRQALS